MKGLEKLTRSNVDVQKYFIEITISSNAILFKLFSQSTERPAEADKKTAMKRPMHSLDR